MNKISPWPMYPKDFLIWREGSGNTVEIFDIQVGSERGRGRGRRMVQILFEIVGPDRSVFAITRSENLAAQQFYEHLRFRCLGPLRSFYNPELNNIDAVMYGRSSSGPV